MKNIKPASGKQSGNIIVSNSHLQALSSAADKTEKTITVSSNIRKAPIAKSRANPCSSSQESLSGGTTSVRRKTAVKPSGFSRNDSTPIRMISNIQTATPNSTAKKSTLKKNNQTNMRRAVSKDSVDIVSREREKENVKVGNARSKNSNNCITIMQMEKEKAQMEQQISELVRNAESKKAEIATLKMEINKLKDLKSDDAVDQLKQELENAQLENQDLKERLVQFGIPLEMTTLSDNQKEQILIQRSLSGSFLTMDKIQGNPSSLDGVPKSLESEVGEASGILSHVERSSLPEWERGSSSSLSEMSLACLQDRIMQMEETHHSTNEELQATVQELTDLQEQLRDLQIENERMSEEKSVLLDSLCTQTEKLEEYRTQVMQLKQLLFQQHNQDGQALLSSERENNLMDLLKKAQEAHDVLLMKQEELSSALHAAKDNSGSQSDLILLRDRTRFLESTIQSMSADKRVLESQLHESREQLSANQIDISQLKLQLENEQQKVSELQREREAGATSELNALLQESRKDKEKVEERAVRLQEQLALSQREVARLKDQLIQLQEENMVAKNNSHKQISDLEYHLQQLLSEKEQADREIATLEDTLQQIKLKCQHHLEDKRELKANLGEMQKVINETSSQLSLAKKDMDDLKKKHKAEIDDWNKFQADLLTTVRVANDFKTEALRDVERLTAENKELVEKISSLKTENEALKVKKESSSANFIKNSLTISGNEVSFFTTAEKDLCASRRQWASVKRNDRGANQQSVRSLIVSIENATKHAKAQGPSSSCSSSSSSLNSLASESRINANSILLGNNEIFKQNLCSTSDCASTDNKVEHCLGKHLNSDALGQSALNNGPVDQATVPAKVETESLKPLTPHAVSILAGKLDPIRRNSYGDINEKKDPLSSLVKGGGSKRNALLKWCQNKTLGYKGIDITNFSSSWNDGLAFCALLHSYLPNMIPYNELDNKDKRRNFTLAFQAAESVGIQTTLNINELISQERPDWQLIMTYVTSVYKHFET